jgi:hypothetical protein
MRLRLTLGLLAVVGAAVALPGVASASQLIDRDAGGITLQVNAKGEALVSYVKKDTGKQMHVLAWGAVNALPPSPGRPQVEFKLDYAGGWGKYRKTTAVEEFRNVCGPYRGPALSWFVTACTAPDGTHWAVQSWQRMLPNYGLQAKTTEQSAWELRLSHWDGELPELRVNLNWAYRKFDHIFGSFAYAGQPVHGFKSTPRGNPLDSYGRNLYVDTLDSAYGPGWKRENSFLMHKGNGKFCYGFYPHNPRPSGMGKKYRATIIGPGVTPDMMWEGTPLGAYNKGRDLALHQAQKTFFGSDGLCKAV